MAEERNTPEPGSAGRAWPAPVELRRAAFGKAVRGYEPSEVDAFLERVREGYEKLWRERLELELEVKDLRAEIEQLGAEQDGIRDVMLHAKRTADGITREARQEADRIVAEASARAEELARDVEAHRAELERLRNLENEMQAGYRAFLLAALELLQGSETSGTPTAEEAGAAVTPMFPRLQSVPRGSRFEARPTGKLARCSPS